MSFVFVRCGPRALRDHRARRGAARSSCLAMRIARVEILLWKENWSQQKYFQTWDTFWLAKFAYGREQKYIPDMRAGPERQKPLDDRSIILKQILNWLILQLPTLSNTHTHSHGTINWKIIEQHSYIFRSISDHPQGNSFTVQRFQLPRHDTV